MKIAFISLAAYLTFFRPAIFANAESCQCPISTSMGVCGEDGITYPSVCYANCAGVQVINTQGPCPGSWHPQHCISARVRFRSIVPIQNQIAFLSDVEIENLGDDLPSSSWKFSWNLKSAENVNFISSSSTLDFSSVGMGGDIYVENGPEVAKGDILSLTYQVLAGSDIQSNVFNGVKFNSIPCSLNPYPVSLSDELVISCCPEYDIEEIMTTGGNTKEKTDYDTSGPSWVIYDGVRNSSFSDVSSNSQVHWNVHDPDAASVTEKVIHAVLFGGGCVAMRSNKLQRSADTPVIAFRIRPSSIWPPLEVHIDNSKTNAQSEPINVASGAQGILHAGEWSTIMIPNNFFRDDVKKWDTISICNEDSETQQSFIANITVYTQEPMMDYSADMDMPTMEGSCLVFTSSDTPVNVEDGLLAESTIMPARITPELLRTMTMKAAVNVDHETVSHLEISLRYESAIAWLTKQRGGNAENFVGTIFSDYGESPIPMGLVAVAQEPFQGEYSLDPDSNSMEEFGEDVSLLMEVVDGMDNMEPPAFSLRVRDTVDDGMTASIMSWSLMLCESPTPSVDDVFEALDDSNIGPLSTPTPGEAAFSSKPMECYMPCMSNIGFVGRSSRVLAREIASYEADAGSVLAENVKTHKAWVRLLPTSAEPFVVRLALEMMNDSGEYMTVRETNITPMQMGSQSGQSSMHSLFWHQFQSSGRFRWSIEAVVGEGSYQSWVSVK